MIGYEEKALCRKIADMFEIAGHNKCDPSDIIKKWLQSDTSQKIFNRDFNEIAQSPLYIYNSLLREGNIISCEKEYADLLYWVGYILTYIGFKRELEPKKVFEQYDVIGFAGAYDTLHTLSPKVAFEEVTKEYLRV